MGVERGRGRAAGAGRPAGAPVLCKYLLRALPPGLRETCAPWQHSCSAVRQGSSPASRAAATSSLWSDLRPRPLLSSPALGWVAQAPRSISGWVGFRQTISTCSLHVVAGPVDAQASGPAPRAKREHVGGREGLEASLHRLLCASGQIHVGRILVKDLLCSLSPLRIFVMTSGLCALRSSLVACPKITCQTRRAQAVTRWWLFAGLREAEAAGNAIYHAGCLHGHGAGRCPAAQHFATEVGHKFRAAHENHSQPSS